MSHRSLAALPAALAVVLLAAPPAAGQAQTAALDGTTAPRTAWGDPDLQGIWDYATMVSLERPAEFAGKKLLTEREVAEREAQLR